MKKYLKYLLADIEASKKNKPPTIKVSDVTSEIFTSSEEYMSSPLQNMSEWFGLDAQAFPPVERWNEEDVLAIVEAMNKLWYTYNYDAAFPEGVDIRMKYKLYVKVLNEPVPWVSSGIISIDFCDADVNSCALGDFCVCREMVELVNELPHKDDIVIAEPSREVELSVSMHRYYEQLLSDLNIALRNLPEDDDFDFEDELEEGEEDGLFERIEIDSSSRLKEEQEMKPISEWLNLPKAIFPKFEQLTTEMVIELVRAIEKIWWHAGYVPYFPQGLNIEMKYQLFREQWDRVVPWPTDESIYLGFCNDDENNCIYGAEMCSCAIYKISFDEIGDDDNLNSLEKLFDKKAEEKNENYFEDKGIDEGEKNEGEDNSLPF